MAVDVVVAGGGIGGLACALALRRTGRTVRVLEQAGEFGEVGAGLQMAPNATRVLRAWGLLDQVVARGVSPHRLVLRDALDGEVLTHLDLADVERRYGAPYVVIHRSDLHALLVEACRDAGVELVTGVRVEDVERPAIAISPGRRDAAGIVVAADGLGSELRGRLSADEPVGSGYVAYRGAVPLDALTDVSHLTLDDVVVYIGPCCHLVQYALRGGAILNQVAVFRGVPDELDAAFAGACDAVQAALPDLWRDRWWPMYDREPIPNWVDGRLVLTGDAAHPMLQYLAQGACQAIEDAACLAAELDGASDVDGALAAYAALRVPRTSEVQRRARAWGDLWHGDGLFRAVRNELLRDRDPRDYRHVDWLYG